MEEILHWGCKKPKNPSQQIGYLRVHSQPQLVSELPGFLGSSTPCNVIINVTWAKPRCLRQWRQARICEEAQPRSPADNSKVRTSRGLVGWVGFGLTERPHDGSKSMGRGRYIYQPGKHRKVAFFRQLWLVLGVKLMEINSNGCFPGTFIYIYIYSWIFMGSM